MKLQQPDRLPFTPIIVLGAGRSGTNVLRDTLTRLADFDTWPCDEINPIWRHGNVSWPDDEIPPERATPDVRRSVRNAFMRIWREKGKPNFVVEKTCANTLRVPFVDTILPEARYIHIIRNGFDVVASARKRWCGELEMAGLPYYWSKARYAPLQDLPRYTISALKNHMAIKLGHKEYFDSWGPRFHGLDALAGVPLDEIIARQWAACVSLSDSALAKMTAERVFQISYEDFTADPQFCLAQITRWLKTPRDEDSLRDAVSLVRSSSVGRGNAMAQALPETVKSLLEPLMQKHGYSHSE